MQEAYPLSSPKDWLEVEREIERRDRQTLTKTQNAVRVVKDRREHDG